MKPTLSKLLYITNKFFIELTLMSFFVRKFSLIRHIKLTYNPKYFSVLTRQIPIYYQYL